VHIAIVVRLALAETIPCSSNATSLISDCCEMALNIVEHIIGWRSAKSAALALRQPPRVHVPPSCPAVTPAYRPPGAGGGDQGGRVRPPGGGGPGLPAHQLTHLLGLLSRISQASGVPLNNIFPLKNFSWEYSPQDNPLVAPLIYSLLRHALICANTYLQEECDEACQHHCAVIGSLNARVVRWPAWLLIVARGAVRGAGDVGMM
jgi:hypothetical protein